MLIDFDFEKFDHQKHKIIFRNYHEAIIEYIQKNNDGNIDVHFICPNGKEDMITVDPDGNYLKDNVHDLDILLAPLETEKNETMESNNDNVNHPKHYNNSLTKCSKCNKKIECIDITRYLNFNIGNAIKYLWRYQDKNGLEDLKKAAWYINDEIKNKII